MPVGLSAVDKPLACVCAAFRPIRTHRSEPPVLEAGLTSSRARPLPPPAPGWLLTCLVVSASVAGCESFEDRGVPDPDGPVVAVLESTIGSVDGPAEETFASIVDFLVTDEDEVWVLDGRAPGPPPELRRFAMDGSFLGTVGGMGQGPGEFLRPYALAQLADGRVAVRDQLPPDRLNLYRPDGTYDGAWSLGVAVNNVPGNRHVIDVGASGVLWLEHRARSRPDPGGPATGPPVSYVRVSPDGAVLDTVVPPALPHVDPPERVGGLIPLPFSPSVVTAWSPTGRFLVGRTDEYALAVTTVPEPDMSVGVATDPGDGFVIGRSLDPVPVLPEDREAFTARMRETFAALGESNPSLDLPDTKPPLRGAWFDDDGRVWVRISVPSELHDPGSEDLADAWGEADVFEVFGVDGQFVGRVALPWGACADQPRLRGDELWCKARGPYDVEILRGYRIPWR